MVPVVSSVAWRSSFSLTSQRSLFRLDGIYRGHPRSAGPPSGFSDLRLRVLTPIDQSASRAGAPAPGMRGSIDQHSQTPR